MGTLQQLTAVLPLRGSSALLFPSNPAPKSLASEPYLHKGSYYSSSSRLRGRDAGRDAATPTCQAVQNARLSGLPFLRGRGLFRVLLRVCAGTGREGKRSETHHINGFGSLLGNFKSPGQLTPMPGPTSAVYSEAFLINKHIK